MEKLIVKLQVSLFSSDGKRMILVYNEDKSIRYEAEITPDLLKEMKGEPKKYFYYHMEGTEMVIDTEAEEQDW